MHFVIIYGGMFLVFWVAAALDQQKASMPQRVVVVRTAPAMLTPRQAKWHLAVLSIVCMVGLAAFLL